MEASSQSVLYMRLKKRIFVQPGHAVTLGEVSRMLAADTGQQQKLMSLVLYRHKKEDGNRVVIDLLQIVRGIRELLPELTIEAYGDPQVLVMIAEKTIKPRMVMLALIWLLLFFGSGLAIMNFHADVSMQEVHIRIVELVTGKRTEHPLWLQIPYSIGIGMGMVLFFNHIFKKRFNEEPNPLEVELYMYQENVNAYVIADEMRKKSDSGKGGAQDDY